MPTYETILSTLTLFIAGPPAILLAILSTAFLIDRRLDEDAVGQLVKGATAVSLIAAIAAAIVLPSSGLARHAVELADWAVTSTYHLKFQFVLDLLSLSYVILTLVLCATIGAFSTRYLHNETGYNRFFILFAVFLLGMVAAALSDTVETLFVGWELVGLSSVLLIAFFHERPAPPRNGQRVWIVYRACDAALMVAAVLMHNLVGGGDFSLLTGANVWPRYDTLPMSGAVLLLGLLFIVAAAGKSALVPFSGWLPRAMEGPTPSSAIFYGALSVHLGAFLLLRISPILASSFWLSALVVALGATTAIFAYLCARVQTDIKSALAFASLTQVGIIVAEIGFGFYYLALFHLVGHACLRTLQFVRAPSLLHDQHQLEDAIGDRSRPEADIWERRLPAAMQRSLYRFSIERGHLDTMLDALVVRPFVALFSGLSALEQRWADRLDGKPRPAEAPVAAADNQR